jgi:hypothetical protein
MKVTQALHEIGCQSLWLGQYHPRPADHRHTAKLHSRVLGHETHFESGDLRSRPKCSMQRRSTLTIERRIVARLNVDVAFFASLFVSRWDVAVVGKEPKWVRNQLSVAVAGYTHERTPTFIRFAPVGAHPQRRRPGQAKKVWKMYKIDQILRPYLVG